MMIAPPREKNTSRVFWSSERFSRLDFEIIQGHLVIFGYGNGQLSVKLYRLNEFIGELKEVDGIYGGQI